MTQNGGDEGGEGGVRRPAEGPAASDPASSEPATGKARKERVLHTRIPAVLEEELKRLATNLKMPVSNVVRAILEDAVEAVEVVGERAEGTLEGIVDRISAQREALKDAVRGGAPVRAASASAETSASGRSVRSSAAEARAEKANAAGASGTSPATSSSETPVPGEPVRGDVVPSCPDPDGERAKAALDGVIGFQRLTLLSESPCTVCGKTLPRGSGACRGVREESGPRVLLGPRCTLVPGSSE